MKTRTLLIAAAMLLALSAAAFGQAIYSASSTPVTTVILSGNAELTGNITLTNQSGLAPVAGTITVQYGTNVPITSTFNTDIKACTNAATAPGYTTGAPCPAGFGTATGLTVDTTASVYNPGLLVIDVPTSLPAAHAIAIVGVRVQISAATPLSATLSATGNQLLAGQTVVTVVNGAAAGLASVTSYDIGAGSISSSKAGTPVLASATGTLTAGVTGGSTSVTTIAIKEGFLNAFTKGVGVRITVSAVPPKGVTFQFPGFTNPNGQSSYDSTGTASVINSNWVLGDSAGGFTQNASANITSGSTAAGALSVYYYLQTDVNSENINVETLEIPVTIIAGVPSTTPYAPGTFTYTVNLAPVLGPYNSSGVPAGAVPRFQQVTPELGPANLVTIVPSTTTLMMTYVAAGNGLETGIAIANTTRDPGTTALGFSGAVNQTGTITFYFFPQNGTPPTTIASYTTGTCTGGDPGSGLSTTGGTLPYGSTYVALLSNLLRCAGASTTFNGYVMAITNFTNAHGLFTVQNSAFTINYYTALMSVLSNRLGLPEPIVF